MLDRNSVKLLTALAVVTVGIIFAGCVRRTVTITTEPPGALVFLNDQEIGRSEVTTDFVWYGDYDVVLRKEGYETLKTHWDIQPPWYQLVPLDFFAEVLWPGRIHDSRSKHFVLTPAELPDSEELVDRAVTTKARALDQRK
ncbi:MAG: PEGA domain-containing protein [Phycisphaerales bacterium]|nr:MAG: PEGA domain-containing protein [Phycisphaerales bacterium]